MASLLHEALIFLAALLIAGIIGSETTIGKSESGITTGESSIRNVKFSANEGQTIILQAESTVQDKELSLQEAEKIMRQASYIPADPSRYRPTEFHPILRLCTQTFGKSAITIFEVPDKKPIKMTQADVHVTLQNAEGYVRFIKLNNRLTARTNLGFYMHALVSLEPKLMWEEGVRVWQPECESMPITNGDQERTFIGIWPKEVESLYIHLGNMIKY